MTTAIIADDEPLLRDELRDALKDVWPELELVGEAGDGLSALKLIDERRPDIAFLDIKMPRLSGLEVAEQATPCTRMVFVTAYDDHAIKAFELNAVDYLVKPIRIARLTKTVARIRDELAAGKPAAVSGPVHREGVTSTSDKAKTGKLLKHIQVTIGKQLRFLMVEEILFIQSDNKYTRIVTANNDAFVRTPLSELLESLDPELFWRIHRGTAVNIRAIESVTRVGIERMTVQIRGRRETLEVSRPHQSQFRGM